MQRGKGKRRGRWDDGFGEEVGWERTCADGKWKGGGGQAEGHCVIVILGRNDTYGVEKEEGTGRRTLYDNGSWEE